MTDTDWPEVEARLRDATRWTDSRGRQLENTFVIRADLLAALARIEALTARQAWLPIESAPRDGTYVLLRNSQPTWAGGYEVGAWYGEGSAACWWSAGGPNGGLELSHIGDGDFTHWLPLPAPPSLAPKEPE